ncbi:MAG: ABC transporter permease [Bacteroidales bacterium]|nr:ABC transporter permease [Bacteroidales bacterium]
MKNENHHSGFWTVVKRECHILTSRPLYLFTALIFPLFALLFMTTIFGDGMINELPVAIVDEDNSNMSRNITRLCSAVPEIRVTQVLSNTAEARDALLSKDIYGYLIIPDNFESDVKANKNTTLTLCYHYAFLSVGSEVLQGFLNVLRTIVIEPLQQSTDFLGVDNETLESIVSPISISAHPLYNPSLNYTSYLTFPYYWVLFQILILLNIAYSFGNEFNSGNIRDCIAKANGKFINVVLGKMFPYIITFSIIAIFANVMMFDVLDFNLSTNIFSIIVICILFIIATCSISLFIFSIYPNLPIIISFISMFGSLGATFAGVTFPVNAMYPFFEKLSYFFPIRHFVIMTDYLRYESHAFIYYWKHLLVLISFNILIILATFILKRKYLKLGIRN